MRYTLLALTLLATPAVAQDFPGSIYEISGVDDSDRADRIRDRAVEDGAKRAPGYYGNRHMRRPAPRPNAASRTPAKAGGQGTTLARAETPKE